MRGARPSKFPTSDSAHPALNNCAVSVSDTRVAVEFPAAFPPTLFSFPPRRGDFTGACALLRDRAASALAAYITRARMETAAPRATAAAEAPRAAAVAAPSKSQGLLLALQTAAGAGSGCLTKTATAPLERVKIIFQVQVRQDAAAGRRNGRREAQVPHLPSVCVAGSAATLPPVLPVLFCRACARRT